MEAKRTYFSTDTMRMIVELCKAKVEPWKAKVPLKGHMIAPDVKKEVTKL